MAVIKNCEYKRYDFPLDFQMEVIERFPYWTDLHRWIEEGHFFVMTYIHIKARDIYLKWIDVIMEE